MSNDSITKAIAQIGQPSIVLHPLIPTGKEPPLTSCLGGSPYLPSGFKWPPHPLTTEPLVFVGQINFADIPASLSEQFGLPYRGLLQYFCRYPFPDDSQDEHFVAWHPTVDPTQWAMYEDGLTISPTSLLLLPKAGVSFVDRETLSAARTFDDAELDAFYRQQRSHQLCGTPKPIQYDPFEMVSAEKTSWLTGLFKRPVKEHETKQIWQLLWQIDSESLIDLNWIDGGIVYLLIKIKDLHEGNLANIFFDLQTY